MLKQKFKTLSLRLLLAIVAIMALPDVANAVTIEKGTKFYLKPNTNWNVDGARFAIYFYGNGDTWVSMTDSDGDGIYEGTSPTDKTYTNLIFCRMNPASTDNNWNKDTNFWNQTGDLTYNGTNNLFTVPDGSWNGSTTSWSVYGSEAYILGGENDDWNTGTKMNSEGSGNFSKDLKYLSGEVYFAMNVKVGSTLNKYTPGSNGVLITPTLSGENTSKLLWNSYNQSSRTWKFTADPKKVYTIHTNVYNREVWVTYTDATITGVKLDLNGETVTSAPYTWTYAHSGETVTKTLTATNVYSNSYEETAATLTDYEFVDGGIYTITYADGAITIDAQLPKQLTDVALTGLDGVSVGDASESDGVYTWSFTYSGKELTATVNVSETYGDGSVENATEAKTETFYNGSDYVITYNVETNELTITPTHKFVSVKCSLFENAASVAPYSWTYNHTKATETGVTLTFTENWTNGSTDYPLEGVTFTEGSAYSITYDAANHKGAVEETSKLALESIKIAGIADAVLTNNEGVYSYEYTAVANGFTDFNFVTVYTNSKIEYSVNRYIGYTYVATATKAGVGYAEYAELDNKSFNYDFVQGAEYTIILDTANSLVKVIVALDRVDIDLAGAVNNSDGTWTYTHTGATAEQTVTFTNVYTDAKTEVASGSVTYTFVEGGVYTISYNNGTPTVTVVSEPKPVISTVTIVGDVAQGWSDTKVGYSVTDEDGDGIYEYSYTATSTENKYFNYYVTYSDGSGKYFVAVDNDNQDLSNSAKSYVEETNWRNCSFTYPFVDTGVYKIILNSNTQTVSVQVISEPVEYAVYFYNDNTWSTVCAWVCTSGKNYTGGTWPGQACTLIDSEKNLWKWTASEAIPDDAEIIFNNNNQGSQTSTFKWVNQAYYNPDGIVAGGDIEEDSTVQITGDEAGGWNSKKNMTQSQTQEGLYYYEFAQEDATKYFSFFINDAQYAHTNGNMQLAVDVKYDLTADPETKNGRYYISKQSQYIYTVYVDVVAKEFWVSAVLDASYKSGIPVYPLGVATEGELAAYDFDANPVYYLCSPVLNDNRISPEWQMVKGADGKFYISGFAMRNTNARDNGNYLEEGNIKVVQFTSVAQEEGDEVYSEPYNETGDENPWSEGRLYNACYDPAAGELTLTKVGDRMPFISMVGYNFQQLENYTTPRKSTTSRGWQEAWILYDENGEVVKDRNGKVLYSTMWPPKNPVYFNAVKGTEHIELSSNNLTFSAVEDYAVKTGDAWEAELKDDDAYAKLSLGSDTEYIRYKIDYMWILGATKIWTGWGGQSASWGSQWDNHMNWGYGSDSGNESGAAIASQTSYTLAQNAGNFLVAEPTYFQTVEFFYNVAEPSSSVFYTTLAHGNPSIRAKATEDYHGNYDIEVKDADGLAITAYTVTRYNAVTNEVDTANADNGTVKNETGDWTADTFNNVAWVDDDKVLANGKYYYVLNITIDGKEVTVQSNPFTIYRPADHHTEVKVMQLLEVSDNNYVTVPLTAEGQLDKSVLVESVTVATNGEITVTEVADQEDVISAIENGSYQWTMKALLRSEVPATWTDEMTNTEADTMQDGVVTNWNLTVNGTEVIKVAPNAESKMLYIYDHSVPSTNSYKATMGYTYTLNDVAGTKATIGKETAFTLNAPQAMAEQQELSVTRGTSAAITGNVIPQNGTNMVKLSAVEEEFVNPFFQPMDKDKGKAQTEIEETNLQSADTYEQVDVTFSFTMPAISEEVYNECVVAYMPKLTAYKGDAIVQQKYLSLVMDSEYSFAPKAIKVTGIDPTWEKVELSIATQYYDKEDMSSFVEGRFGTAPVMKQEVSFSANETLSVSGEAWQYERMARKEQEGFHYEGTGKFDLGVSNVTASFSSGNATISEFDVEAPAYYNLGVVYNANSFASPYVFDGKGHDLGVLWAELAAAPTGSVTLEVRPLYFFETISGMELSSTGLAEFDPAATPATASTTDTRTFVALYGKTNSLEISNIQTSVEDAVMSGAVVKAGQGYIEVVGAETSSVYSVSGAMVGNDESRYDVVPGVYVVIADGKAVKVVVR